MDWPRGIRLRTAPPNRSPQLAPRLRCRQGHRSTSSSRTPTTTWDMRLMRLATTRPRPHLRRCRLRHRSRPHLPRHRRRPGARPSRRELPSPASPLRTPAGAASRHGPGADRQSPRRRDLEPPANWPPPRPPRPPRPPSQGQQQYSGPTTHSGPRGPETRGAPAAPAGHLRRPDPRRRARPHPQAPPGRGWRLAVSKVTFGLINLGPSPAERRLAELEAKIGRRYAATTRSG